MANFNFNKVILGGRLCADPEIKTYKSKDGKKKLARLRLAVNRNGRGEKDADFITCTAFDTRAEFIDEYFHKGDSICLEGRLTTGSYENNDGDIVYTTEVTVDSVHFVDSRNDRYEDDEDEDDEDERPAKAKKSQGKQTKTKSKGKAKAKPKYEEVDEDDDLPF